MVQGITEDSIRAFIKSSGIGCTGRQVKFRSTTRAGQQLRAVHIQREWFAEETLTKLDTRKSLKQINKLIINYNKLQKNKVNHTVFV